MSFRALFPALARSRVSRTAAFLLPRTLPLLALAVVGALLAPRSQAEPKKGLMDGATRAAIDRGLRFLVRTQNADGSWTVSYTHLTLPTILRV